MKVFLMHAERDFAAQLRLPPNEGELIQDLELETLFDVMAAGDPLLLAVARQAVLSAVSSDLPTIDYRQSILKDCLENQALVREMYALAGEARQRERKEVWASFLDSPSSRLSRARQVLQIFVDVLKRLRAIVDRHAHEFQSPGFARLFATLQAELSDAYFASVDEHLKALRFRGGVLISAGLGKGNKGADYVLRQPPSRQSWITRLLSEKPPSFTLHIHPRDESGARCLSELRDQGLVLVANALAQAMDHVRSFFEMLRYELAFYIGCINLHEALVSKGAQIAFPRPQPPQEPRLSCKGLYDVCLALSLGRPVVGNEVNADGKRLLVITGANQGGKSTFLRSVGLAQLMMQAGMFVPALSFSASVCYGLFTHYKREEDATMEKGKLEEELSRMNDIVEHITDNPLVLFNESFAATNEREGSEIARQIVQALVASKSRVAFVTHLFDFADRFYREGEARALFLRAERLPDGKRTFKLIEGEPLETSHGKDLYEKIFGETGGVEAVRAYDEVIG